MPTPTLRPDRPVHTVVVGGGLAGLTAAALVARAGHSVAVLERADVFGGRAATRERGGILFNLGPHALYAGGHAFRLLTALGVPFTGRPPATGRSLFLDGDTPHPIPAGLRTLLTSRLLTAREKWRLARLLPALRRVDTRRLDRVPAGEWVADVAGPGRLADALRALVRVSTYADDFDRMSAGAAADQLRTALSAGVWYLDDGWQTLVDGLRARACAAGANVRTGARADAVEADATGVTVRLDGGGVVRGRAAVLAVGPDEAVGLLGLPADHPLARWAIGRAPVRAACLDVALARLPRPRDGFALGLDRPLYYSVHSAAARLAPAGVAVVHAAKYLGADDPAGDAGGELEALLDRLQPGWQGHVVARQFLPRMTVTHALPRADEGGLAGRPGVAAAGRPNVWLAGDWVGGRGQLADAAAASAEEAAARAVGADSGEGVGDTREGRLARAG